MSVSGGARIDTDESATSEGEGAYHGSPAPGSVTSEGDAPRHRSEEEAEEGSNDQSPAKRMKESRKEWQNKPTGTHQKIHHGKMSAAAGDGSSASLAAPSSTPSFRPCIPTRPADQVGMGPIKIRHRLPPYPTTGKKSDLRKWQEERRSIGKILAADPKNDLPTRRQPKDPETTRAVKSLADKAVVHHAARSIVTVCIVSHDGCIRPQCTGIIIDKWKHDADSPPAL